MTKGKRFAIVLALVGAFAPGAGAQEPQAPARPANPMMELMRKHDQKIDELLAKMNEAKGEAKVDAIAAVLNEIVAQRKETRQQMSAGRGAMRGSKAQRPAAKPTE
jgi:hypothetical protein